MELQADAKLTKRENQIAGLAFCGKAKKEIADLLNIAYGTVNVILDRAYKKTGTSKLNELGSWWANRAFALNIDFQQLQKTIVALSFLGIIAFQIAFDCNNDLNRSRQARIRRNKIEEVYELSSILISQHSIEMQMCFSNKISSTPFKSIGNSLIRDYGKLLRNDGRPMH